MSIKYSLASLIKTISTVVKQTTVSTFHKSVCISNRLIGAVYCSYNNVQQKHSEQPKETQHFTGISTKPELCMRLAVVTVVKI
jgi:hypothetical protein